MKVIASSLCRIYYGTTADGLQRAVDALGSSSVFIICDENTRVFCLPKLNVSDDDVQVIVIPSGELNKNLNSCQSIWSSLIEKGADRESVVLNLGGGVICDMGGFAAACYQRGIRFAHIPTTILAMSDAAIGGKLGVDHDGFKNYVGLIQNPDFIWIDPVFIETLPPLELISGLSEIVKHAIIGSERLWDILSGIKTVNTIRWEEILEESISVKVKIVENDMREHGLRKVLNFGHTIGHALESFYLSSRIGMTHGQCVALGMLVEAKIAASIGLLNTSDFEDITASISGLLSPEV
ncbi:MAG: 3-dehydroquinate synthase family protein, partial [Saprospiraceae bacterium]